MPFGTISKIDLANKKIEIRTDDKNSEVTLPLSFGDASLKWYLEHKTQFPIGQLIEFSAGKGQLFKMKPAAQVPTPAQRSNEIIINEKLKQAGFAPNPENKDYSQNQFPAAPVTIGSYDPKGVTIKIRTTCPTPTQYENIAIEVEGPDAETCRRALIESYSVLGNAHPATKDFITAHIKRVLLKEQ